MNQTVLKQSLQSSTSGQNNNNVVSLRDVKHAKIQARIKAAEILKQRLIGVLLLIVGVITTVMSHDATAFIFLTIFAIPMLFSKKCIMNFRKGGNNERKYE